MGERRFTRALKGGQRILRFFVWTAIFIILIALAIFGALLLDLYAYTKMKIILVMYAWFVLISAVLIGFINVVI